MQCQAFQWEISSFFCKPSFCMAVAARCRTISSACGSTTTASAKPTRNPDRSTAPAGRSAATCTNGESCSGTASTSARRICGSPAYFSASASHRREPYVHVRIVSHRREQRLLHLAIGLSHLHAVRDAPHTRSRRLILQQGKRYQLPQAFHLAFQLRHFRVLSARRGRIFSAQRTGHQERCRRGKLPERARRPGNRHAAVWLASALTGFRTGTATGLPCPLPARPRTHAATPEIDLRMAAFGSSAGNARASGKPRHTTPNSASSVRGRWSTSRMCSITFSRAFLSSLARQALRNLFPTAFANHDARSPRSAKNRSPNSRSAR